MDCSLEPAWYYHAGLLPTETVSRFPPLLFSLLRLDRRSQGKGRQLVAVKLCLFQRLQGTERHSLSVRFHHNLFASCPVESEHPHQRPDNMLHVVHVIVVQKHFEPGKQLLLLVCYRSGLYG
jgi:hypothetical protein